MTFLQNTPGINKRTVNPAISPQTMPQLETPVTPSKAKIRTQVNANMNEAAKTKTSGQRIGFRKKNEQKTDRKDNNKSYVPRRNDDSRPMNRNSLNVNQSDFGYDIGGISTPNQFNGSSDQTLFRDYNIVSEIKDSGKGKIVENRFTNCIKLYDISLTTSLNNNASYQSAYEVIYNKIYRDVASNTRGAAGALSAVDRKLLLTYLDTVSSAFDALISLEVLQAWDPHSNTLYDRTLRKVASLGSTTEILEARTRLRQALIPHILPNGWMKYIKWMRQTHLAGMAPESTKLRMCSSSTAFLMNKLCRGDAITDWVTEMNTIAASVSDLDPKVPAIILANVSCIPFSNVKDYYSGVYNGAVYDAEFNNLFNNRTIRWKKATVLNQYPDLSVDASAFAAFDTPQPYSLSLANVSSQFGLNGALLEGGPATAKVDSQGIEHSVFNLIEQAPNLIKMKGVEKWYEYCEDSTHVVDMTVDGGINSSISMPRGNETMCFVAADSNIAMAQREAFDSMTLIG